MRKQGKTRKNKQKQTKTRKNSINMALHKENKEK